MTTTGQKRMRLNKSARLVVLLDMDEHGLLDGTSLQKVADLFNQPKLNRSTILRDIKELPALREEINMIYSRLGWNKRKG
jgi:hypothetical protein